jgi:hypothetical protein
LWNELQHQTTPRQLAWDDLARFSGFLRTEGQDPFLEVSEANLRLTEADSSMAQLGSRNGSKRQPTN